jgi:hypothetical protein
MRELADLQRVVAIENKTRVESFVLDNRRVTVRDLEHDLDLLHGTIVRLFRSYAYTRLVRDGFREHYLKTTRREKWLEVSHSSNSKQIVVMISSKYGHWRQYIGSSSLPGNKTFKHAVETFRVPTIEEIEDGKSAGKLSFGTTRVYW